MNNPKIIELVQTLTPEDIVEILKDLISREKEILELATDKEMAEITEYYIAALVAACAGYEESIKQMLNVESVEE